MLQPLAAVESPCKYDSAYCPVCKHSDPYAHWPKAQDADEKYTETKPAGPHGTAGGNHGKFYISGCTQAVSWYKTHCPDKRFYDRDPCNHMNTHCGTFFFHTSQNGNRSGQNLNDQTASDNNKFRNDTEFFYVIDRLIFPSGSKALPYNRHQADTDTDSCNSI